jgi:hypothetical protein
MVGFSGFSQSQITSDVFLLDALHHACGVNFEDLDTHQVLFDSRRTGRRSQGAQNRELCTAN